MTGASLGGELATTLAALDARITAIAVSGYGGHAGPLPPMLLPDAIDIHLCHIIPGTQSFLRQEDMTLLLAPRPTLILLGGIEYKEEDEFVRSTASAWRALGAPDRFKLQIVPKRGHEFFVEETAAFFTRILGER